MKLTNKRLIQFEIPSVECCLATDYTYQKLTAHALSEGADETLWMCVEIFRKVVFQNKPELPDFRQFNPKMMSQVIAGRYLHNGAHRSTGRYKSVWNDCLDHKSQF